MNNATRKQARKNRGPRSGARSNGPPWHYCSAPQQWRPFWPTDPVKVGRSAPLADESSLVAPCGPGDRLPSGPGGRLLLAFCRISRIFHPDMSVNWPFWPKNEGIMSSARCGSPDHGLKIAARLDFGRGGPYSLIMTNERSKAVEMARELVRTTRYTPEQACEAVLRTDTGARLGLSRDQTRAVAELVTAGLVERPESYTGRHPGDWPRG